MRTEFIQTKIRPIKKMFIIESGDYPTFFNIFKEIQNEIDATHNLFFQNNDSLWSDTNKEFVKRHDPDVILNFTQLDNEKISKHFDIWSITPDTNEYRVSMFGTKLFSFTNFPLLAEKYKRGLNFKVYASENLEQNPFSMLNSINYGFVDERKKLNLKLTIFKDLKIETIKKPEIAKSLVFQKEKRFICLTNILGSGSGFNSIYEIDYNPNHIFEKGNYVFVSPIDDMSALLYYWNTRATYDFTNLFWLPQELFEEYSEIINDNVSVVCFNDNIENALRNKIPGLKIIRPDRYYFGGSYDRWECFEYSQNINIESDNVLIQHPADKCFSDIGIGGACVLEIRHLREFTYPVRRNIGNLYRPDYLKDFISSGRFFRISSKGLSIYVLDFDPLNTTGLTHTIKLPSFEVVISHLMKDAGYEIRKTPKSLIIEQLLKLLGGISETGILCQKMIFDLISSLTPLKRTEKAIKQIFGNIKTEDAISEIGKAKENGIVEFPSITLNIEQITSKAIITKQEKQPFMNTLQKLYNKKILLRGKSFICPYCASNIWLPLEEIGRQNYCHDCNNEVELPVHIGGKLESDYYRLNQLVTRAIDQGQLSTLLLLNFFSAQKYSAFDFLTNIDIYQNDKRITDIDLFLKISKKLGLVECKSNSGFENQQVDELLDLAKSVKCDFVALSCLLKKESTEIVEIIEHIKTRRMGIPVFIFTEEVLFDPSSVHFYEYFERWGNTFRSGPILVGQERKYGLIDA
jgi:hypothetical protein